MELEAFRAAYPESVTKIDCREWRYIETKPAHGDAPALIMLPGAFGAAELFWNQMAELGDCLRMVSVTLPAAPEASQLADGVMALADHLGLTRFSLLGTSLGGFIAQLVARDHSDRLDVLFVANSLVRSEHLGSLPSKEQAEEASGAELRARIVAGIEKAPETEPAHTLLKATLLDHGARCLSDDMIKTRLVMVADLDEPAVSALPGDRIVVIESDDDKVITPEGCAYMRARYADSAVHTLQGGGHFPYVTRAEQYNGIIAGRLLDND
jgi:pimeloyl-ACP methyl ester carboxylesterase